MKKITSLYLLPIANAYIILSIAYYWLETSTFLNPIAIGLVVFFGLHLFVAKKGTKLIFPSIFIALNLIMFLALFSEFNEFPSLTKDAMILLGVGTFYLGLNVLSAVVMVISNLERSILKVDA